MVPPAREKLLFGSVRERGTPYIVEQGRLSEVHVASSLAHPGCSAAGAGLGIDLVGQPDQTLYIQAP